MTEEKVKFKVRAGRTHGKYDQFKAGDIVELTVEQAKPFSDKLIRLGSADEVANNESIRDEKDAKEQAELEKAKGKAKGKSKKSDETKEDGFEDDEPLNATSEEVEAG